MLVFTYRPAVYTWIRVNRSAFKQHSGSPVSQGPVDGVTVSSDPADVCHTAKHVPILVAEDILGTKGHAIRKHWLVWNEAFDATFTLCVSAA